MKPISPSDRLSLAALRDFFYGTHRQSTAWGAIGRAALKLTLDHPDLDLVAMNDLVPPDNLAYLLRHDTAYGRYNRSVEAEDDKLIIDPARPIPSFSGKRPGPAALEQPEGGRGAGVHRRLYQTRCLEKHLQAVPAGGTVSPPPKVTALKPLYMG